MALEQRFWCRVDRHAADECWPFRGSGTGNGYGQVMVDGHVTTAHRVAWRLTHGTIPSGMMVLHRCDNRRCCNPNHLFLGTAKDNTQDMLQKGRHGAATKPERVPKGERNGSAKLTANEVSEIRRLIATGAKVKPTARRFGVDPATIRGIRDRRLWKCL